MIVALPLRAKHVKCLRKRAMRELRGGDCIWKNEGMKERLIKEATDSIKLTWRTDRF
jgi:Ran GTPase-activating protein (RanGAP) involved in mRNA processing and transport